MRYVKFLFLFIFLCLLFNSFFGFFLPDFSINTVSAYAGGDGSEATPYQITKIEHLFSIRDDLDKNFTLMNDLDFEYYGDYNDISHKNSNITGTGWNPIGDATTHFTGTFNGSGYNITNLFINRSSTICVGLFGSLSKGAVIHNISILKADVTGKRYVGILAGGIRYKGPVFVNFSGTTGQVEAISSVVSCVGGMFGNISVPCGVHRCYSKVDVVGPGINVGGFVGEVFAVGTAGIYDCYSTGSVDQSGGITTGGFCGNILNGAVLENCYSTGEIIGSGTKKGFLGGDPIGVGCTNCFYDNETSGQTNSYCGTGYNTSDMQNCHTFNSSGWNITGITAPTTNTNYIWNIENNSNYPFLSWQNVFRPTVTTNASTGVEETNATFHGYLDDDGGSDCTIGFQYGTSTGYGSWVDSISIIWSETFDVSSNISNGQGITSNGTNILIVDVDNDAAYKYDMNFSYISNFSLNVINSDPRGIVIGDTYIWVTNPGTDRAYFYYPNGTYVGFRPLIGDNEYGLAFYNSHIYTSERDSATIRRYNLVGTFKNSFNVSTDVNLQGLVTDGNYFWAVDGTNQNLYMFSMDGTNVSSTIISNISNDDAQGVTVVGDYVFVLDENNNEVYKYYLAASTNNEFNYIISGLSEGTLYHHRSFANNTGYTSYGVDRTFLTKPLAPTGLSATAYNTTQIDLTWTKGTGAEKTYIERNTVSVWARTSGTEIYNNTGTSYSDTDLSHNTTYYYQAWSYVDDGGLYQYSDDNDSDYDTTYPEPELPTGITVTSVDASSIALSWTVNNYADTTYIERNTSTTGTVWTRGDGTEIYNNSGTSYTDTGIGMSTNFTYRFWSYNNTYNTYNISNSSGYNWTYPDNPSITDIKVDNTYLNFTWTNGTGCDTTLIVQKANSYPTGETDGTVIYNDTNPEYSKTSFNLTDYFTLYTYNSTSGFYSSGIDGEWGVLVLYVYKENEPWIAIGNYTVFISNSDASDTYYETDTNNPTNIDVDDIPYGDNTVIQISKEGYKTRSKVEDTSEYEKYNFTFYLPPDSSGSPDDEQDEPWYIPPSDVLITDIFIVDDYTTDEIETLECSPGEIEEIYIYNTSIGWVEIADDEYTLNGNILTVDSDALDKNSSMIKVLYYCDDGVEYSSHYIITVRDDFNNYVENAYVIISRYINSTDTYSTIISDLTDSSGQIEVDLIPDTIYHIKINKSGFDNMTSFWSPSVISYVEDAYKQFIIFHSTSDIPPVDIFKDIITFQGIMYENSSIQIIYNDSNSSTINTQIYLYELYNNTLTYVNTSSLTSNNTFSWWNHNINTSRSYIAKLYWNNTATFDITPPYLITIYHINKTHGTNITGIDINQMINNVIGPAPIGNWASVISITLAMILLILFGPYNTGVGIIGAGIGIGLSQALFGIFFINSFNPLLILLGTFCIAIGILYFFTKGNAEEKI